MSQKNNKFILLKSLLGGVISTAVIIAGSYAVGRLSNSEAIKSIQEMLPSLRFTCSAVLTATSTILALLLTLLSFTGNSEYKFKSVHYQRVQWIARFATAAFVAAITMLLLLNIPIEESEEKMNGWYDKIYYVLLVYGACLGGLMISIVIMLYQTASAIILIYHPDKEDSYIIATADEKAKEQE